MTGGDEIRVLLADDHTMFRQGLKEMLATDGDIRIVGEAENGAEAVEIAREEKPDVVVLDVEMPVMGASVAMEEMLKISPQPRVLIVSMYDSPSLVRDLLSRGASGYLVKSASLGELLAAVHRAAKSPHGGRGDNVILAVPRAVLEEVKQGADGGISGRELEILLFAARGLSNRQIASRLHLAEGTIKRHLSNAYHKMGVGSRGEAAQKALQEGWITTGDLRRGEG